jgi:hypothetical protein
MRLLNSSAGILFRIALTMPDAWPLTVVASAEQTVTSAATFERAAS